VSFLGGEGGVGVCGMHRFCAEGCDKHDGLYLGNEWGLQESRSTGWDELLGRCDFRVLHQKKKKGGRANPRYCVVS
jgi:hypothetical protein